MRKGLQRAAIVLGLAMVAWWLLPRNTSPLGTGLALGVVALRLLLIAILVFVLWVVGFLLWGLAKSLYRRLALPYRRARNINRIRNYRAWQEAASRNDSTRD